MRVMEWTILVAGTGWVAAGVLAVLGWRARSRWQRARASAAAAQAQLQDIFDALDTGLVVYDRDDRLRLWNADFARLYPGLAPLLQPGLPFETMLRQGVSSGFIQPPEGDVQGWIDQRLQQHRHPAEPMLRQLADGTWRRITERRLADGGMLSYSIDVTTLVRQEQALRQAQRTAEQAIARLSELTETDALTGIANRRRLDRLLAEECARVHRHGYPLSVLLIDIDHFKAYNDAYGHAEGDVCLKRVAQVLAGCARRPGEIAARFGGEEFVLLLPHTGARQAEAFAADCLRAIGDVAIPHAHSDVGAHVTLSIGVACTEGLGADFTPGSLLVRADHAMYRAKRAGRHGVVVA
jgi:diguanylate cyclase (GGDEF)-like protein